MARARRSLVSHEMLQLLQPVVDAWLDNTDRARACYCGDRYESFPQHTLHSLSTVDRSLGCFVPDSWIREKCVELSRSKTFNSVVDAVIFLCTISLAINCPKWVPEDSDGWTFFSVYPLVYAHGTDHTPSRCSTLPSQYSLQWSSSSTPLLTTLCLVVGLF